MSKLVKVQNFNGSLENVYDGISQYDQYSEYLPGVTGMQVLEPDQEGSLCKVRYELKIIKEFYYTLHMFGDKPHKIWWTLCESNILKDNTGSWEFKKIDAKTTEAQYELDIKFRGLVPRAITDKVAAANLPLMFAGFQRMIDDHAVK